MRTLEVPNTIEVTFSCKDNASAEASDYTITVDLSELTAEDLVEWACNNGIVVYLQGRVRAGKLADGATYKLHKPGTRSTTPSVLEGEQLEKARVFLAALGKPDAMTGTAEEVSAQFHEVRRALEKVKREAAKKS